MWRMLGEGTYVVGIEPCTNRTAGRLDARERGELIELEPGRATPVRPRARRARRPRRDPGVLRSCRGGLGVNLELDGKTFVAGGASKGLGRAVAEALVGEGARVLVVSREPEQAALELGPGATACAADLATVEGIEAVVASAAALGELHGILVNSGGPPPGDVLDVSDEAWEAAFRLLVGNPVRLLRALRPSLADGASILFVTSSSVRVPIPGLDTSNVLRPGVAALVKCLALELGPRVRVNSLAPGRIDTGRVRFLDETRAATTGVPVEEIRARNAGAIALGRYGEPAELGRVGAFLLSPAASYVSGAAIQVDGGYVTAIP